MLYGFDKYIKYFDSIIKNKRFANGYLFYGIEGIGKKLFAREIARVTLCKNGSFFNEICECDSCKLVLAGCHPDLLIFTNEGDEDYGIDQIREISESCYLSSFMGGYKFYILDNFHTLKKEACNAFLKTLEEPGENTVFFLITSQIEKVLPTIRSRCIHLRFSRLGDDDLREALHAQGFSCNDIDKIIDISGGSISLATKHLKYLFKEDSDDKTGTIEEDFDWDNILKHASNILKMAEKDDFRYYIIFLLGRIIEKYRESKGYKYLILFDMLLDIYRMLDYNVNLRILKANLLTKIDGVLSEKI